MKYFYTQIIIIIFIVISTVYECIYFVIGAPCNLGHFGFMRVTNQAVQSVMLYFVLKYIINIYLLCVCVVVIVRAIMALRGSRGTALLNRNLDTAWRWVVN